MENHVSKHRKKIYLTYDSRITKGNDELGWAEVQLKADFKYLVRFHCIKIEYANEVDKYSGFMAVKSSKNHPLNTENAQLQGRPELRRLLYVLQNPGSETPVTKVDHVLDVNDDGVIRVAYLDENLKIVIPKIIVFTLEIEVLSQEKPEMVFTM
mgnify:CR=1 FL=1|tara:strand:- start:71895 stop:72356 length:462 start_codon:yes stop_codon:yes gene_type:complete